MRGYRAGTRAVGLGGVLMVTAASTVILVGSEASDVWIGGLVFTGLAAVMLRGTFRPRIAMTGRCLIIDQPLWRWVIPRGSIESFTFAPDVIVHTRRRQIHPFAFSHSLLSNWLTGDVERRRAGEAVQEWLRMHSAELLDERESLTVWPAVRDVLLLVGGWQGVYWIGVAVRHW